ncbi:MAG: IS5/IS1182 family transposase, partial [Paracoccus sp. (in: a-proteobacteria)]
TASTIPDGGIQPLPGKAPWPSRKRPHERAKKPALFRDKSNHRRSRAETKMHCVKLLGQRLNARDFDRQVAGFQVRVAVLNGFTALGIPVTQAAG